MAKKLLRTEIRFADDIRRHPSYSQYRSFVLISNSVRRIFSWFIYSLSRVPWNTPLLTFKYIFLNENYCTLTRTLLKFVPTARVEIMISQHLSRRWHGTEQATCHHLNRGCPKLTDACMRLSVEINWWTMHTNLLQQWRIKILIRRYTIGETDEL